MSNWTHVAGVIRVDSLRGVMPEPNWDEIFGKELDYGEPEEDGVKYMPAGSEGSLSKVVYENDNTSSAAAYVVVVVGDLRDHYDAQGIVDWFKDICMNHDLWIRQASITVENELNGTVNWSSGSIINV